MTTLRQEAPALGKHTETLIFGATVSLLAYPIRHLAREDARLPGVHVAVPSGLRCQLGALPGNLRMRYDEQCFRATQDTRQRKP